MGNVGLGFGVISFVLCMSLSARVIKLERMLKKSGINANKSESLGNVLVKNVGEYGTLTFRNGSSFTGDRKIICKILDVDEEWVYLEDTKEGKLQLLHIDSICSVKF